MADELEEHAQHFKEHLVFQKPSSARVTAEEVGVPPKEGPPPTLPACGVKQEIQGLPGGEAGTSGCENFLGGAGDVSMDSQEEDAEVLVRFRVNQHIAVTVHKVIPPHPHEQSGLWPFPRAARVRRPRPQRSYFADPGCLV